MTPFEKCARDLIASRGAEGTRELYTIDLDRWLVFCAEREINVEYPTPSQAAVFRDTLASTRKSATVRRTLAALSRMYRAAVNAWPQAAKWNPFDADTLARPPASDFAKTEALAHDETLAIMAYAVTDKHYGVRDTAILRLLYDTGLRISAVVTLRREKIFRRGDVTLARVRTKNKDEVDVELTTESVTALDRWLAIAPVSPFVFPAPKNTKLALSRLVFYKRLRKYGDAVQASRVHPHRFRTTYITDALDAEIPLNKVQASVHHASPVMTQRYDRGKRGTGVAAALAAARAKRNT